MASAKSNFGLVAEGDEKTAACKCTHSHVGRALRGEKTASKIPGAANPTSVYIVCSEGECKVLRKGSTDTYRGTDVTYPGRLAGAQKQFKDHGWPIPDELAAAGAGAAGSR